MAFEESMTDRLGKVGIKVQENPQRTVIDYVAGLRKTGPNQYAVVIGRVENGRLKGWQVDSVSQSLEFSSEALKMAMGRILLEIP